MNNNLKQKLENNEQTLKIALDGPSASGKGTIGRILAKQWNLQYFQSSLIYRGLAFLCLQNNLEINDIEQIITLSKQTNIMDLVKKIDLQQEEIGIYTSKISTIEAVRSNLTMQLMQIAHDYPRIIMEGRDIGTVVFPEADLKIFIDADVNQRAMRRYKQLRSEGKECIMNEVLKLLKERDARDSSRKIAPLIASDDALVIDTSDLSPHEVISKIEDYVVS